MKPIRELLSLVDRKSQGAIEKAWRWVGANRSSDQSHRVAPTKATSGTIGRRDGEQVCGWALSALAHPRAEQRVLRGEDALDRLGQRDAHLLSALLAPQRQEP
eukprot:6195611-Pleurochrysis_carterae.AAC.3